MSFDIPSMHIDENSPEARAVEQVMNAEHVGPVEAVRSILRKSLKKSLIDEAWGALSGDKDSAMMDDIVEEANRRRYADQPRDFGL